MKRVPCLAWIIGGIFSGGDLVAIETTSGAHVLWEGRLGWAEADSIWREPGEGTVLADLQGSLRPLFAVEQADLRLNAEIQITGAMGDSVERGSAVNGRGIGSETTFFDWEQSWQSGDRSRASLWVDRLALTWSRPGGTLTFGRHALTWGGGLVFNPFDLFNPFSPSDVVRDYKVGADMIHLDVPTETGGWQLLAVGRRDPVTRMPSVEASSLAFFRQQWIGSGEMDALVAWHYDKPVCGLGFGGLLGEATWRVDVTWQEVRPLTTEATASGVSAVTNIQYSWLWGGHNVYGVLEYYYNQFGRADPLAALADPFLAAQRRRANAFLLGEHYFAGTLQVELHPLINLYATAILNLHDPSGLLQPRVVWNASSALTVTGGFDLPFGAAGTEFGGYPIGPKERSTRAPMSAYLIATWDF